MYANEVQLYLDLWSKFKFCCEHKAKIADCHINSKGWQKLREYHLERFLKDSENPYGFLFKVKYRYRHIYREVHCMPRLYHKYSKLKQQELLSPSREVVKFPSWKEHHEKGRVSKSYRK